MNYLLPTVSYFVLFVYKRQHKKNKWYFGFETNTVNKKYWAIFIGYQIYLLVIENVLPNLKIKQE